MQFRYNVLMSKTNSDVRAYFFNCSILIEINWIIEPLLRFYDFNNEITSAPGLLGSQYPRACIG